MIATEANSPKSATQPPTIPDLNAVVESALPWSVNAFAITGQSTDNEPVVGGLGVGTTSSAREEIKEWTVGNGAKYQCSVTVTVTLTVVGGCSVSAELLRRIALLRARAE